MANKITNKNNTCPICGEPARKMKANGRTVFAHNVLMHGGVIVAVDGCRVPDDEPEAEEPMGTL